MEGLIATGFSILFLILISLFVYILFGIIPVYMARQRGRNQIGWFLFSLFFSPFFAMFALLCLGDTDKRRFEKIQEEEEFKQTIKLRY